MSNVKKTYSYYFKIALRNGMSTRDAHAAAMREAQFSLPDTKSPQPDLFNN